MTQTTVLERDNAGLVRRTRQQATSQTERVSDVDYDSRGIFPRSARNAGGHVTWFLYKEPIGQLDRVTDPNGAYVEHAYDKLGRLRRTQTNAGPSIETVYAQQTEGTESVFTATTTSTDGRAQKVFFDRQGRPSLVLQPGYHRTAAPDTTTSIGFRYDALGNVVEQSFAKLAQAYATALTATPAALRSSHHGVDEIILAARYDQLGRPASTVVGDPAKAPPAEGAGERTTYVYPRLGVTTTVDPAGNETRLYSDTRGQLRRRVDAKAGQTAIATNYAYSSLGTLTSSKADGAPKELFVYDRLGRLRFWFLGGTGQMRSYAYNGFDEIDRVTEPSAVSVKMTYDTLGRPLSRIDDLSGGTATERVIRYEWDTSARAEGDGVLTIGLAKVTVDGGHETRLQYDNRGRPHTISEVYSGGPTLTWGYRYDSVGRTSQIRYPSVPQSLSGVTGGVPGATIVYKYASNGQTSQITDETVTPIVEVWNATERHPLGMLQKAVNGPVASGPFSSTWAFQANTLRPKSHTIATATTQDTMRFTYRPDGALESKLLGNFTETYTNAGLANRLTRYTRANPFLGGTVDASFTYSNAGDIATLVTAAVSGSPDWPPVGTRTFTLGSGGSPFPDVLTQIQDPSVTLAYSYDATGRQIEKRVGGVRKRTIDSYNTFSLPTAVSLRDGNTLLSTTAFAYDGFGGRVSKKRGTEQALYVAKLFEAQSFRDLNTNTDVRRSLFRIYADGRPVAERLHDWTAGAVRKTQYLYTDLQGSVVYRTDGSSTVRADGTLGSGGGGFRGFHPYGQRWRLFSEPPAFSSIGFTGHQHDDDLGLIHMNGRVYDPEQMRFISRDPMALPFALGGTNAYAYVLGNPTNLTDPSGFSPCDDLSPEGCEDDEVSGPLGDPEGWKNAAEDVAGAISDGANQVFDWAADEGLNFVCGLLGCDDDDSNIPPPPSEPPPLAQPGWRPPPPGSWGTPAAEAPAGPPQLTRTNGVLFGDAYEPPPPPAPAPTPAAPPAPAAPEPNYFSRLSAWERDHAAAARDRGGVTGHLDALIHDMAGSVADVFSNTSTFGERAIGAMNLLPGGRFIGFAELGIKVPAFLKLEAQFLVEEGIARVHIGWLGGDFLTVGGSGMMGGVIAPIRPMIAGFMDLARQSGARVLEIEFTTANQTLSRVIQKVVQRQGGTAIDVGGTVIATVPIK